MGLKSIRILFVNHGSQLGGAEYILLDIVRELVERSCVWLFEDGPLRGQLEKVGVRTILCPSRHDLANLKRDRSLMRALPMLSGMISIVREIAVASRAHDLIYANTQKAFVLSAVAAALARRPLVWHLHDMLTVEHFGKSQIKLVRILANRLAKRVIVPSDAVRMAFIRAGGKEDIVRVVPNGVTLPFWDGDRTVLRMQLGLPPGFIIGVFSRLAPWKGQHVLLQALASIPSASCLIVGGALFGEDDYAAELNHLAKALGVAHRTYFLGQRDDVPMLMRAVNVVVHPSVSPEPFGRTLVEAMLARTPIVATATGAVPEILADGTGIMVPSANVAALTAAIEMVQGQGAAMAAMVDRAEQRAREMFSSVRMQTAIREIIRGLMVSV